MTEALKYFSKSCEYNNPTGCDFAGKMLASFEPYVRQKVPQNPQKGLEYLERGCNAENLSHQFESSESCYAAAFIHAIGFKTLDGIEQNNEKGLSLAVKSCDLGKMEGCKLASKLYSQMDNSKLSELYLKRYKIILKQMNSQTQLEMQRT